MGRFVCQPHNISQKTWEEIGYKCVQTTSDFNHHAILCNLFDLEPAFLNSTCWTSALKALLLPSWVMACSTFRKMVQKYNVLDLAIYIPSKRTHYINPKTTQILNKTNFDSLFISRGLIETRHLLFMRGLCCRL